jgi:hypothetical protein
MEPTMRHIETFKKYNVICLTLYYRVLKMFMKLSFIRNLSLAYDVPHDSALSVRPRLQQGCDDAKHTPSHKLLSWRQITD